MYADNPRELLAEIKKYMYLHDISQDDLANKMNKSKQSVSLIFRTANPTLDTLFCVLQALDIELDYSFVAQEQEEEQEMEY